MIMDAPCKGCKERHEVCWQSCEKYLEYKVERQKLMDKIACERRMTSIEHRRASRGKAIGEMAKKIKKGYLHS